MLILINIMRLQPDLGWRFRLGQMIDLFDQIRFRSVIACPFMPNIFACARNHVQIEQPKGIKISIHVNNNKFYLYHDGYFK